MTRRSLSLPATVGQAASFWPLRQQLAERDTEVGST